MYRARTRGIQSIVGLGFSRAQAVWLLWNSYKHKHSCAKKKKKKNVQGILKDIDTMIDLTQCSFNSNLQTTLRILGMLTGEGIPQSAMVSGWCR